MSIIQLTTIALHKVNKYCKLNDIIELVVFQPLVIEHTNLSVLHNDTKEQTTLSYLTWVQGTETYPTLLHMTGGGNRTPDLLALSSMPYPLDHMLPLTQKYTQLANAITQLVVVHCTLLNENLGMLQVVKNDSRTFTT